MAPGPGIWRVYNGVSEMKYRIETNADNGDSFYSEEFDTIEKATEEMVYQWRLLPYHTKSELRRRGYLSKSGDLPYMAVLGGMIETAKGILTYTDCVVALTLAEMIEAKEEMDAEEED